MSKDELQKAVWGVHHVTCHMTLMTYTCQESIAQREITTIEPVDVGIIDGTIDKVVADIEALEEYELELEDDNNGIRLLISISGEYDPEEVLLDVLEAILAMEPVNISNGRMVRLGRGDEILTFMVDDPESAGGEYIEDIPYPLSEV